MIIAGNNIYDTCGKCYKLVKINKTIFGSLHVCRERPELSNHQYANMLQAKANQEALYRQFGNGKGL